MTSLHILQTNFFLGWMMNFVFVFVKVVLQNSILVLVFVKSFNVQMQCRRSSWLRMTWYRRKKRRKEGEREQKSEQKQLSKIAAKCLISMNTRYKWEMAQKTCSNDMTMFRATRRDQQNECVCNFPFVVWNMVHCSCAINHFVSTMIYYTQKSCIYYAYFGKRCIESQTRCMHSHFPL